MPLIVLEGLDGAGKTTQTELLKERLESRGLRYEYLHFPRFDAPVYGGLIARFLRGELGGIDAVDPYLVALLFAGDRADAAAMIRKWLARGKYVLLDRYVNSNIAYQCAKVEGGEAREMLRRWILDLEYGHNAIPRPDVPRSFWTCRSALPSAASPHHAAARTGVPGQRRTLHEASLAFQRRVREIYLGLAEEGELEVVDCRDEKGDMCPPQRVFARITEKMEGIL